MWYWIAIYFYLANKLTINKVNIHSIIHCTVASLISTYVLLYRMNNNLFSSQVGTKLQNVEIVYKPFLSIIGTHSLGYFIADTLNIIINQPYNRKYIFHHIFAIFGIFTIFWESYISTYAIWSLEIGGIVHHLKYAADVYRVNKFSWWIIQMLYHVVYVSTRILIFINITNCLLNISNSYTPIPDSVGIISGYGLVVQNGIWW